MSLGCGAAGSGSHQPDTRPEALGHVGYFSELLDEWAQDADADERLYRAKREGRNRVCSDGPVGVMTPPPVAPPDDGPRSRTLPAAH